MTRIKTMAAILIAASLWNVSAGETTSDLHQTTLPVRWDEAMPLGNATVGALVWQRDSAVRFSLDRTDLWDLRPIPGVSRPEYSFGWVREQVRNNSYGIVQELFDKPYDEAAPSKIPGAALEFDASGLGEVVSVHLSLDQAETKIRWADGAELRTFVHATEPVGWFVAEGVGDDFQPTLIAPKYQTGHMGSTGVDNLGLGRLGYTQGEIVRQPGLTTYHQVGWNGFYYDVAVAWERRGNRLVGTWSITSSLASNETAEQKVLRALSGGVERAQRTHRQWWTAFHDRSAIMLPDTLLQRQYDNEMYKLGSVAREDSYPISLQAVWTADNGNLPPWKGDYHHDLNTQLSYWPVYTGNHLTEGMGYLNTLWDQRETHKEYTRKFYGTSGLNVPGVCDLQGKPMGGWIQYAFGPTISAWLSQHFYLHWKYSADREFLETRAYPYLHDVAVHLDELLETRPDGRRQLPLSSSPEFFDNSREAWFSEMTNYDRALIRFTFTATAELAGELGKTDEASRWKTAAESLPGFVLDSLGGLSIAPGYTYDASHRHFSHLLGIHPLGLIDVSNGPADAAIIDNCIAALDHYKGDYWTGYSYAWVGSMKARVFDGDGAAEALRTFAACFCLPNTFHVNGDQSGTGKSKFTYRPFTLEGNFAFAAGIQEMLLQSHTGVIRIFPAIPAEWDDVSFRSLRSYGAFLVSACRREGRTAEVEIFAEKGGQLRLADPFGGAGFSAKGASVVASDGILTANLKPGKRLRLTLTTDR